MHQNNLLQVKKKCKKKIKKISINLRAKKLRSVFTLSSFFIHGKSALTSFME